MNNYIDLQSEEFVYIGKDSKISGKISLTGPTTICSDVEGDIEVLQDSPIRLERDSKFKGTIHCKNLYVYGKVEGEIISSGVVSFYPTSSFKGKIKAQNLNIHPGASVNMQADTDEN